MKLPNIFMTSSTRFVKSQYPRQVYINGSAVTSYEQEEIERWCEENSCRYYAMGVIEFPNEATMTLFLMRWL